MKSLAYIPGSNGAANASLMTVQSVRSALASTITVNTVSGAPTKFYATMGTPHTFTDPVTGETITVISEATAVDFAGHIDSGHVEIDVIAPGYTDLGSSVGDIIIIRPVTEWANNLFNVLSQEHNDDGTHGDVTATSLTVKSFDGWVKPSGTWTYVSATSMTVPSADAANMAVGTKIGLTQTTQKYFYVTAISGTTITINGGSDYTLANAAITVPKYSNGAVAPGFPGWFNYTPIYTGFSANPSGVLARFKLDGKSCTTSIFMPNNGTSNATTFTVGAPIPATSTSGPNNLYRYTIGRAFNNSGIINEGCQVNIGGGSSVFALYTGFGDQAWTASNGKSASFTMVYEV